jgi:single-strand DNA-binding protein
MLQAFGRAIIGRDCEVRYTPEGTAVANLSLAFSYGRKGEDGKRPTQWVDASLWGKQAESMASYLVKGQAVVVVLEDVHIETFKRSDNTVGSKLAARVASIEFAGPAPQQSEAPAPAPQPKQRPAPTRPAPASAASGFDDMDDDIPF